jgi:glutamate carboxypeptidase
MVEALGALVEAESPTSDLVATNSCLDVVESLAEGLIGSGGERVTIEGRSHLLWRFGDRVDVLLLGHLDTVWPVGTLETMPFTVTGDRLTGPGCFDMKAGVIQLLYALSALDDLDGVAVLLTTDEEIGSPTARDLIVEVVKGAKAALVLEPSKEGALKIARKGVSTFRVTVRGRSAHAGLEPEKGINAGVELAHQVLAIGELGRSDVGTTVTPTMLTGGSSSNSVPSSASVLVDARCETREEAARVKESLQKLSPCVEGTTIEVESLAASSPLPKESSRELFDLAGRVAEEIGLGTLEGVSVGGGSDGNVTAGAGVRTLDGLGAVGGGAHADDEHVIVSAMAQRSALVSGLVSRILRGTA